jgi:alanine dehydrogenase
MKTHKTLILDKKDVEGLVDMQKAVRAMGYVFREHGSGRTRMPAKIYLHLDKYAGDFRAMPAYVERLDRCALKWVNVHVRNKRLGLPTVMAIIILSDPRTGLPLCVMEGTFATSLRTGAAGGVAAKCLARKDSHIIGMVGCGAQARAQLQALTGLFDIKEVKVWGNERGCVGRFIRDMKRPGVKLVKARNIETCVRDSDIVVTTTPSRKPLVRLEWLKAGAHINAIGADAKGKEELEPAILKKAKVVVDSMEQASHSGEINVPLAKGLLSRKDVYADIGEIVTGRKKGRTGPNELTVFDSTGLAIQDVAVAELIYRAAVKKGVGRHVKFV